MSSNSTASPGGDTPCCKATTLLAVAATAFLFCFVVVVVFLFIRFLLQRRRWRRRSASRLLLQQQHRPKLGLDAAAIALIPSFPYRVSAGAYGDAVCPTSGPAECAVCLSILDEGQMARELPGCKHVFHRECIDVWLASRASCPVCRGRAEPPPARADERAAAASTSSARVVAIEMFDDEVSAPSSSSTPGETEETVAAPWMRPSEVGSGLA